MNSVNMTPPAFAPQQWTTGSTGKRKMSRTDTAFEPAPAVRVYKAQRTDWSTVASSSSNKPAFPHEASVATASISHAASPAAVLQQPTLPVASPPPRSNQTTPRRLVRHTPPSSAPRVPLDEIHLLVQGLIAATTLQGMSACLVRLGEAAYQGQQSRNDVGACEGVAAAVHCLAKVPDAASVCLANLTYGHTGNRELVVAAGGATALTCLLQSLLLQQQTATPTSAATITLIGRVFTVLDNIAASARCQEALVDANVTTGVCQVMRAFSGERELQLLGCRILGRLAEGDDALSKRVQELVATQDGVTVVAAAFQRFHADAEVSNTASSAMTCLTAMHNEPVSL